MIPDAVAKLENPQTLDPAPKGMTATHHILEVFCIFFHEGGVPYQYVWVTGILK